MLCWSLPALAHYVPFDFIAPSGLGQRTDGGFTALQWADGDFVDQATVRIYAQRSGLHPFEAPRRDVALTDAGLPVKDPRNVVPWDARALDAGCYQPFAEVIDEIEGITTRPAGGIVAVGNATAVWVLNPVGDGFDAGTFSFRFAVDEPDDPSTFAIGWLSGTTDAGGELVRELPLNKGGGTASYTVQLSRLPPLDTYYLWVESRSADGSTCRVFWNGHLAGPGVPSSGFDAGSSDAGVTVPPAPGGCGCGSAPSWSIALAALAVASRRRSKRTR